MTQPQTMDPTDETEPLLHVAQSIDSLASPGRRQKQSPSENIVIKTIATMICFSSMGLHSASIGSLIPLLETFYDIKDDVVTLIFIAGVLGYLIGAISSEMIHLLTGRRGIAIATSSLHIMASALLVAKPRYQIALVAYFSFGLGSGFADAGFCAWAANVNSTAATVQGLLHGSFSVGCVIGPIIVAALDRAGFVWNAFYIISLAASCLELCALFIAFRYDNGQLYRATAARETRTETSLAQGKRPIIFSALFYLCYVGMESSLSSWLATFMSRSRGSSTFIAAMSSSIFWGGMALGRFTLGLVARATSLRVIVIVYIGISLLAQALFHLHHLHIAISFALVAAVGFSFGPMFPAGVLMLTAQLPVSLHVRGCSLAASVGQIGGAVAPSLLGLVSQSLGIERLLDLVLVLSTMLLLIWLGFSRSPAVLGAPVRA